MPQSRAPLNETASQTAGPYLHIGLQPSTAGFAMHQTELGQQICAPDTNGTHIRVEGIITDGTGAPVTDALFEVWQANASGHYAHPLGSGPVEPGFCGWARVSADFQTGEWGFDTIKPGPTSGPNQSKQAPHLNIWIVARGINIGLNTRMYFADESAANAQDPVLSLLPEDARRATLIAKKTLQNDRPLYRFDIRLQGENETVYFDI